MYFTQSGIAPKDRLINENLELAKLNLGIEMIKSMIFYRKIFVICLAILIVVLIVKPGSDESFMHL